MNAADYYDEFSRRYDDERRAGYFGFISALEFEFLEPLVHGKKVLEVGCGTGLILEKATQLALSAQGVDISSGMVNACTAKGLTAQFASVENLPFADGEFDVVYAFKVLPHVPDIAAAITEIIRVTKPGGRMVLEFYNPLSVKGVFDFLRRVAGRQPIYHRQDSPGAVRKMLPPGVRVVRTRGVRIFGLFAACFSLRFVRWLNAKACDGALKRFAGYYIFDIEKIPGT